MTDDTAAPARNGERRDDGPGDLAGEVRALREEMTLLREHQMFRIYQSVPKVLFFRFAIGMAAGLGTVIGASVLLSAIIWALSQIEFVPIVGDWAVQIADEIEGLTEGMSEDQE